MTTSSPIADTFRTLNSRSHMAFMPFITAGDPDLDFTIDVILTLADQGADLIEIGFPYSDPVADGPVIQSSYTRAMNYGISVDQIFESLAQQTAIRPNLPPLVGMVSYAIIFRQGRDAFVQKAKEAGLSGLIVPDLPVDQVDELKPSCDAVGLDLIALLAPTSPRERAKKIAEASTGFLYCIAVAGITGEREKIASELIEQLDWLQNETEIPLCVGFGISKPEHVAPLRHHADGVIIGSAIVRLFEQLEADPENSMLREQVLLQISDYAASISQAAHQEA